MTNNAVLIKQSSIITTRVESGSIEFAELVKRILCDPSFETWINFECLKGSKILNSLIHFVCQ